MHFLRVCHLVINYLKYFRTSVLLSSEYYCLNIWRSNKILCDNFKVNYRFDVKLRKEIELNKYM